MAHVGVLEELKLAGIQPDLIVGCSAGAIAGVLYADNPDIERMKTLLREKNLWDFLNISLGNLPFGLSNGLKLKTLLTQELQAERFEELKIPFVAVATNLEYGDLVVFGTGNIVPAIRASAAFPGVFLPVKINGQHFVDGGVVELLPVETARRLGAEFVIAVDLSNALTDSLPGHVVGVLNRSLEISLLHQSRRSAEKADFTIKIPFKDVGTFEQDSNQRMYELGRKTAREAIVKLRETLALKWAERVVQ